MADLSLTTSPPPNPIPCSDIPACNACAAVHDACQQYQCRMLCVILTRVRCLRWVREGREGEAGSKLAVQLLAWKSRHVSENRGGTRPQRPRTFANTLAPTRKLTIDTSHFSSFTTSSSPTSTNVSIDARYEQACCYCCVAAVLCAAVFPAARWERAVIWRLRKFVEEPL